ncbi:tRNA dimethylallyltransferase [hydrothermal vent metagenome]|uniref:tRNA dimethylallyltransferase n=1 Tax=hydrothermal vent metagenome TaxID=652676 RepID=A0A1W1D059_9ZZZZ
MYSIQQLAIIGATASGKTSLAIKLAHKINAHILSLDSLSVYKEIDIVSAKPTKEEQEGIVHFGINILSPHESFDVKLFIDLYHSVYAQCVKEEKNLIIVGGTSFYLKMLIEGISQTPSISEKTKKEVQNKLLDKEDTYKWLLELDPHYMSNIASKDSYRIEKALEIYIETSLIPSEYFKRFPPIVSIQGDLPIYQITWERSLLRKRIAQRTLIMLESGLIDEVCNLEAKYTRTPNAMKSIGIKETLAYLDGIYNKEMLIEKITTNTARLAKRQTTFNNSQFRDVVRGSLEELEEYLISSYSSLLTV